jgi:predicted AlkP superfamily pyrophosphatase or phosphodiesterase
MRKGILLSACLTGCICLGLNTAISSKNLLPNLVVISIDGLKPDYVSSADLYGLKIPNLKHFQTEGTFATGVKGVLPTVTYPSHTTLVTGVSPARHGIIANQPFDPFHINYDGWYWYAEDIQVPTLWDAATQAGMITSSVNWPVTVGAKIQFNIVQYWRAGTPDDQKLIRALSTPGLVSEAERELGPYPNGKDETLQGDQGRTLFNVYLLEKKQPQLHFCYFSGLDTIQHQKGPYSPEAFATLESIDELVGKVWAAAERSGEGMTIICVVSDHGFFPTDKEFALNTALLKAGLIETDSQGTINSWRAFAWSSGGSAAIMIRDKQDAESQNKVRSVLHQLASDPNSGIARVLEKAEILTLGGFPEAAFVVGMKKGYKVVGSLEGPINRSSSAGGSHGFLAENTAMESTFLIFGPGVPRGKNLGKIDMRDIAPTLASRLGLELPAAEGRNLIP